MTIDIGDIVTANLTKEKDRKDHKGLSVSDISNDCARAVWWRIHKNTRKVFDGTMRKKFAYGFALEKVVQEALEADGYDVLPPMVVVFHLGASPQTLADLIPAEFYDEDPSKFAGPNDVVGHPDLVIRKKPIDHDTQTILVEVKSTMLFRNGNGPPVHPDIETLRTRNGNYLLQAAAYAKAVGAKEFIVYVSDRGTGLDHSYTFNTDKEYPAFEARKLELLPALNPAIEPEPTLPSWTRKANGRSYLCTGCAVRTCKNNLN